MFDQEQGAEVDDVFRISVTASDAYISNRNEDPTPFIWTKSARQIIKKIERGLRTLEAVH